MFPFPDTLPLRAGGLGLVRLMRWTEHDADAFAARYADGAALAAGLRLLGDDHPRGPVARLLAPHPPPAERVRRVSHIPGCGERSRLPP